MTDSLWAPALAELEDREVGIFGPKSFRSYVEEIGDDPRDYRTPAHISINTLPQLARELREHDTMVFRLGYAPEGSGTGFGLARVSGKLDEFFIREDQFEEPNRVRFDYTLNGNDIDRLSDKAREMLDAYRILPNFSETSLVNLALSTGVICEAIDLDVNAIGTAPTTVASTFSFDFKPHSSFGEKFHHNNGQVEIDAMVVTRRNGKRVLLVIEAKTGQRRTLAKHKLMYPYLSIEQLAPDDIQELIPIYLRGRSSESSIRYDIYEGCLPSSRNGVPAIDDLEVVNHSHFSLAI